jgi:pyruvate/2-oxoglutarate dehydrogenase complex dihydrolipoamide dehydrogenase (E3) component
LVLGKSSNNYCIIKKAYDNLIISLGYSQKLIKSATKFENMWALRIREGLPRARTLVIIKGGNLGVELASLARKIGRKIT